MKERVSVVLENFTIILLGANEDLVLASTILDSIYNHLSALGYNRKRICLDESEYRSPSITVSTKTTHYVISITFRLDKSEWIATFGDYCELELSNPNLLDKVNQIAVGLLTLPPNQQQLPTNC